jgi:filamentous hemagglutinin family protein
MVLPPSFPISLVRGAVLAACACGFATAASAQLTGLSPLHGSAVVQTAGTVTTVVTANGVGTNHSALDWRSFGVPVGTTVFFSQPNSASLSINRVLGGDPSTIAGTLGSNGQLVLVNPAGIAVAPGAVVDTAGFTATTLGMSRSDAIAGRLAFGGKDSDRDFKAKSGEGRVEVRGQVLARNGDVVLIGPDLEVDSGAIMEANAGDVVLAAGHTVEVTGRGLEGIRMQLRAPDDHAVNLGTLRGDSVAIFAGQLRHSGVIQAQSATRVGGRVVLQATDEAEVGGSIIARTLAQGGSVLLMTTKLSLKSGASVDVSHASGGGEILVGGGWQGDDSRMVNAREVEVERGVVLKADATLSGKGGTVVVWSEERTRFAGTIQARGTAGQVGGRVEVSGARHIEFSGAVDVLGLATPGTTGTQGTGGSATSGDSGDSKGNSSGSGSTASSGGGGGTTASSGSGGGTTAGSGSGSTASSGGGNGSGSGNDKGTTVGAGSGTGSTTSGSRDGDGNSGSGSITVTVSGDGGRAGSDRGSRGDDGTGTRRVSGHPFDPGSVTTVALVPREAQPEVVQAALREPAAASEGFMALTTAKLDTPSPKSDDRPQPKVVVSDTRCAVVTR